VFVGEPSDDGRHYFELMCEAQEIAIEALGPGGPVADVDRAVWEYFEEWGVADLARHHVGHNIGLGAHEPPYVDRGWDDHCEADATSSDKGDAVVEPGHVYTIDPGLYTEEAGYRHSDTVAITEDGVDVLTYFPRNLEGNVERRSMTRSDYADSSGSVVPVASFASAASFVSPAIRSYAWLNGVAVAPWASTDPATMSEPTTQPVRVPVSRTDSAA
jgi:hypothetical protein